MAHEEQLCFWVNIHNALVMHVSSVLLTPDDLKNVQTSNIPSAIWKAFMAYGLQEKRMKSTDLILKVYLPYTF
jgi:hypothetical protein